MQHQGEDTKPNGVAQTASENEARESPLRCNRVMLMGGTSWFKREFSRRTYEKIHFTVKIRVKLCSWFIVQGVRYDEVIKSIGDFALLPVNLPP